MATDLCFTRVLVVLSENEESRKISARQAAFWIVDWLTFQVEKS